MTIEEFTLKQQENKAAASAAIEQIIQSDRSASSIYPFLKRYIGAKFFLEPGEMTTDNLIALCDISTEKLAGLKKGGLELADKSAGCTSVASSVIKKTLLIMSLQKAFSDVTITPDDAAYTETITDLAKMLQKAAV